MRIKHPIFLRDWVSGSRVCWNHLTFSSGFTFWKNTDFWELNCNDKKLILTGNLVIVLITAWKVSVFLVFLSVFSRIWTEYGEIRSISPYSVWMRKKTNQKNFKYGHFLRSGYLFDFYLLSIFVALLKQNLWAFKSMSFKRLSNKIQASRSQLKTFRFQNF